MRKEGLRSVKSRPSPTKPEIPKTAGALKPLKPLQRYTPDRWPPQKAVKHAPIGCDHRLTKFIKLAKRTDVKITTIAGHLATGSAQIM